MTTSMTVCTAAGALAAAIGLYFLSMTDDARGNPPRLAVHQGSETVDGSAAPAPLFILGEVESGGAEGSGRFSRSLPPDGSWAQYRLEMTRSQGGEQRSAVATLTVASVGQTVVDGRQARFLELTIEEGDSVQRSKVLVPEGAFGEKSSPVHAIIRAWSQRGDEGVRRIDNPVDDFKRGPFETLFPGDLANPQPLEAREFKIGMQETFTAAGVSGEARLVDERGTDDLKYRAWSHADVPFGLIVAEITEASPDRAADRDLKLTLIAYGADAASKLPVR